MDVEEDDGETEQRLVEKKLQDKVLVKDDNYIVTERKGLPVEVQQAISLAGQFSLSFTHFCFADHSYASLQIPTHNLSKPY